MEKLLLEIPTLLETSRLIVRRYEKGDGDDLFNLLERNNNREYLRDHIDEVNIVNNQKEAELRTRQLYVDWISRERFILGVWLKADKTYIGQIWIEPKKWDVPSFELGWFLDRKYQGKGLATEAAKKAVDFIFKDLHAHKIIVLTREDNEKSIKLAKRCGFIKEGHLRDHAIKNGRRFGLYCYRLLKNEYVSK